MSPWARVTKAKINKWNSIQLKSFCTVMKSNLYFKAGQRKIKHKILSVCACGPLPSLPNMQCASMLHINQTSSEMGVPAQA